MTHEQLDRDVALVAELIVGQQARRREEAVEALSRVSTLARAALVPRDNGVMGSHWDGCEAVAGHQACAIAALHRARDRVAELEAVRARLIRLAIAGTVALFSRSRWIVRMTEHETGRLMVTAIGDTLEEAVERADAAHGRNLADELGARDAAKAEVRP